MVAESRSKSASPKRAKSPKKAKSRSRLSPHPLRRLVSRRQEGSQGRAHHASTKSRSKSASPRARKTAKRAAKPLAIELAALGEGKSMDVSHLKVDGSGAKSDLESRNKSKKLPITLPLVVCCASPQRDIRTDDRKRSSILPRRAAHGGADQSQVVAVGNDLEKAALQGAHLHHFLQVHAEQTGIDVVGVGTGQIEAAGAIQMDAGSGGGSQRTVPEADEGDGAGLVVPRREEHFFRLQIEKAEANGAVAHDAFQVSHAAAAAIALLGVERNHGVATLPNAFAARVPAEADAIAQVPDAHQFFHRAARGGDAGCQRIGGVQRDDRRIDAVGLERLAQARRDGESL